MSELIPTAPSELLYYHRVFMRTSGHPHVEDVEPLAKEDEIAAFIAEVIRTFCHREDIRPQGACDREDVRAFWALPMSDSNVKYFHTEIIDAVTHPCAINDSIQYAKEFCSNFDVVEILKLETDDAKIQYARGRINKVVANAFPRNITFIYGLALASYLCGKLAENKFSYLAPDIVRVTTYIFKNHFPEEWIYYDFKTWAFAYSFRHKQIGC